jgi:hypothetical protein
MKTVIIVGKNKMARKLEEQLNLTKQLKTFRVEPEELYQYKPDLIVSTVSESVEEIFLYDSLVPFISQNELREGHKSKYGIFNVTIETIILGILFHKASENFKEIAEANLFFVGRESLFLNWYVQIKNKTKNALSKTSFDQWFPEPFNTIDIAFYRPAFAYKNIQVTRHYGRLPNFSNVGRFKAFIFRSSKPYQKACIRVDFWGKLDSGEFTQKSYAVEFDELNLLTTGLRLLVNTNKKFNNVEDFFEETESVQFFKNKITLFTLE